MMKVINCCERCKVYRKVEKTELPFCENSACDCHKELAAFPQSESAKKNCSDCCGVKMKPPYNKNCPKCRKECDTVFAVPRSESTVKWPLKYDKNTGLINDKNGKSILYVPLFNRKFYGDFGKKIVATLNAAHEKADNPRSEGKM